jgi:hypothetical protein
MTLRARLAAALLSLSALSVASTASAHPFGLSSTNRLFAVEPDARGARVAYVLDFAELPTTDELTRLDADRDGQVLPAERERYLDALFDSLARQWQWAIDGVAVRPRVVARSLEVAQGEANLHTLRVLAELRVDRASGARSNSAFTVSVRDESYGDRAGWRELRAEASALVAVETLEGAADPSILARRAAGERVTLRMNAATFRVRPSAAPSARSPQPPRRAPIGWILFAVALAISVVAAARRLRERQ